MAVSSLALTAKQPSGSAAEVPSPPAHSLTDGTEWPKALVMPKIASGQPLRSAERLLKVLSAFEDGEALGVADLCGRLSLAQSTVRRLVGLLEESGYLQAADKSGLYRLDVRAIRLGAAALADSSLVQAAAPHLDRLRDRFDEAVQLSIRDGDHVLIVDHRQSRHQLKVFHQIGHRYKATNGGAAGKALLAWLPEASLRTLTEGAAPAFLETLARARAQGYAVNDEESEAGVWSAAVPLRDHHGAVVAALTLPCPLTRAQETRRVELIAALREEASGIAAAIPFTQ